MVATMCKHYAHTHPCGHTKTVFARSCVSAALLQKPCGRGEIWASVTMQTNCAECADEAPTPVSGARKAGLGEAKRYSSESNPWKVRQASRASALSGELIEVESQNPNDVQEMFVVE